MKFLKNKKYLFMSIAVFMFALIPLFSVAANDDADAADIMPFNDDIMPITGYDSSSSFDQKFVFKKGQDVELRKNVVGSSAMGGTQVDINKNVFGIAIATANSIELNSDVDYLMTAGMDVRINGNVANDAFVFGSTLVVSKDSVIGRDAFLSGQEITISGNITRDLKVYGITKVVLKGATINGNVTIDGPVIEIDDKTVINGKLKYLESATVNISDKATIAETGTYARTISTQENVSSTIYSLIRALVVFIVAVLIAPNFFAKINKEKAIGSIFSIGLASLILIPILAIILAITSFGLSLGIIVMVLYFIIVYTSIILAGYLLGTLIWNKFIKKEENPFMIGALGIVSLKVLIALPYIGAFIAFASLIFGMGLIIKPILIKNAR